jgi:hypothetical protein
MRTTLSLDDDVTALLKRMQKERDLGLKEIVNEALRRGLRQIETPKVREPFKVHAFEVGKPLHPIESLADALAFAEGEDHK